MALLFIINIIAFAVVFYAALCWGNHAAVKNCNKLDELAKRGVSGRGTWVGGHGALWRQCWRGTWGGRCKPSSVKPGSLCTGLCLLRGAIDLIVAALCGAECFQRSFILAAIRFYNAHCLHKCDRFFLFVFLTWITHSHSYRVFYVHCLSPLCYWMTLEFPRVQINKASSIQWSFNTFHLLCLVLPQSCAAW